MTHFSHNHELASCEVSEEISAPRCHGCSEIISGSAYRCESETCVEFYLHKSCAELPVKKEHPLHPNHQLILLAKPPNDLDYFVCEECRHLCDGFAYHCTLCLYTIDVKCASLTDEQCQLILSKDSQSRKKLDHFSHTSHMLTLVNYKGKGRSRCYLCEELVLDLSYCCLDCEFFIHKSCAEIPQEYSGHSLHPNHALRAVTVKEEYSEEQFPPLCTQSCNACRDDLANVIFCCDECKFNLHFRCAIISRWTFRVDSHKHDLIYFTAPHLDSFRDHQIGYDDHAYACNYCGEDSGFSFIRCVTCDHNFHPKCILPNVVESKWHSHGLTLMDYYEEDDPDAYICDVCEFKREPGHDVYCCDECSFVSHLECIISEWTNVIETDSDEESTQPEMDPRAKEVLKLALEGGFLNMQRYFDYTLGVHPRTDGLYFGDPDELQSKVLNIISELEGTPRTQSTGCFDCVLFMKSLFFGWFNSKSIGIDAEHKSDAETKNNYREEDYTGVAPKLEGSKDTSTKVDTEATTSEVYAKDDDQNSAKNKGDMIDSTIVELAGKKMILQHFTFDEHEDGKKLDFKCLACLQQMSGLGFICEGGDKAFGQILSEKTYLHISCAELPREKRHPLHPKHSLTLLTQPPASSEVIPCGECRDICFGFFYYCKECQYGLDLKCFTNSKSGRSSDYGKRKTHIYYHAHQHKLTLFNFKEEHEFLCSVCNDKMVGQGYGCSNNLSCTLTIHESCAERPPEMLYHPICPQETLTIKRVTHRKRTGCGACRRHIYDVRCCLDDYSNLHVYCADACQDILKHKCHEHQLVYVPYYIHKASFRCNVCKLHSRYCSFYRCMECLFDVHLECIPLPKNVKCKGHSHALKLFNSFKPDDSDDWFVCDVCERDRNPYHHVYYCEECDYFAHIHCAIPEEDTSLEILSLLEPPCPTISKSKPFIKESLGIGEASRVLGHHLMICAEESDSEESIVSDDEEEEKDFYNFDPMKEFVDFRDQMENMTANLIKGLLKTL